MLCYPHQLIFEDNKMFLTNQQACKTVQRMMIYGTTQDQIRKYFETVKVLPAGKKPKLSKIGRNYRTYTSKYARGMPRTKTQENARRVRQIAAGIIPAQLVYSHAYTKVNYA
jgi:hypothetical protein